MKNLTDKALDIMLDFTASQEWEDICDLDWRTDEVQELLVKALKQGQTLPLDSVSNSVFIVCENDDYGRDLFLAAKNNLEEAEKIKGDDPTRNIYEHEINGTD